MFATAEAFQEIIVRLSVLRYAIASNCKRGKYDISTDAEDFFAKLLNIILGTNLVNLNITERPNFPAIDLGDRRARLSFQVTADNSSDKIKDALDLFNKHGLDAQYDHLIVLILTNKRQYTTNFEKERLKKLSIWDLDDLLSHIEGSLRLDDDNLIVEALEDLTSKELPGIVRVLSTSNASLLGRLEIVTGHPPVTARTFLNCYFKGNGADEDQAALSEIIQIFQELKNNTYIAHRVVLALVIRDSITAQQFKLRFPYFQGPYLSEDMLIFYPNLVVQAMGTWNAKSFMERVKGLEFLGYVHAIEDMPSYLAVSKSVRALDCNFFYYLKMFLGGDIERLKAVLIDLDFRLLD